MTTKRAGAASWLPRLDEFATGCEFPIWDNMDYPCGAMRATGFLRPKGWVLVFEAIVCPRVESDISRYVYAFGPGLRASGMKGTQANLVHPDELVEHIDDLTQRSRLTGRVLWWAKGKDAEGPHVYWPQQAVPRTATVKVLGETVTVPLRVPSLRGRAVASPELLKRAHPEEALLFQLCDRLGRETLFAKPVELARFLRLRVAEVHFQLDDWQHPAGCQPASSSPDLVEMVAALEERRPLGKLRGKKNGDWRCWLAALLPLWSDEDAAEWQSVEGTAPPPVEPRRPKPSRPPDRPEWLEETTHPHLDGDGALVHATGFVSSKGPLLVLQEVEEHRLSVFRCTYAYGPGTSVERISKVILPSIYLVRHDQLFEIVKRQGSTHWLRCRFRRGERITVKLLGQEVSLELEVPEVADLTAAQRKQLARLSPSRVLLYALCEAAPRSLLFAPSAELAKRLRLPRDARVLFEVDDFELPTGRLGSSPDLVAMAEALASSGPLMLPGRPNAHWHHWLGRSLKNLRAADKGGWTEPVSLMYADD